MRHYGGDVVRALIALVAFGGVLYLLQEDLLKLPSVFSEKPVEGRYADAEIECAALTMLVDTRAEPSPRSNEVDERVIRTILNYATFHKTDLCKIFRQQLTLIPIGASRRNVPDRRQWWVKAFDASSEAVDAAVVLVKKVVANPDPKWRATHYIRAPLAGTLGNQTTEEIETIRSTMVAVPKKGGASEGVIEFFVPK